MEKVASVPNFFSLTFLESYDTIHKKKEDDYEKIRN